MALNSSPVIPPQRLLYTSPKVSGQEVRGTGETTSAHRRGERDVALDRAGPSPRGRVIVAIKKRGYVGWPRIADCGRSHRAIGVPAENLGSDRQRGPRNGPAGRLTARLALDLPTGVSRACTRREMPCRARSSGKSSPCWGIPTSRQMAARLSPVTDRHGDATAMAHSKTSSKKSTRNSCTDFCGPRSAENRVGLRGTSIFPPLRVDRKYRHEIRAPILR
jgi:hypothetical protein